MTDTSQSDENNSSRDELPKYGEYYVAIVRCLRGHGGAMANKDLEYAVSASLSLSAAAQAIPQAGDTRSKFQYQLAWARTHLKSRGIIENPSRGHWRLSQEGHSISIAELKRLDERSTIETPPAIPQQGDGPKFKVESGVIAFAQPSKAPKGDRAKLKGLHPVVLHAATALTLSLDGNSGLWPHLERSARRYLDLVDVPLDALDFPRLFGEGVILTSALEEARRQEKDGNSFPVSDEPALLADSLIYIHGAFLMLSSEGKALALSARQFRASKQDRPAMDAEEKLLEALVDAAAPIRDDVKEHIAQVAEIQSASGSSTHTPAYKSAAIGNLAIAITGAAVITTVAAAGGALGLGLGAAAVALLGGEALKKTTAFRGSTDYLAGLMDGALARFFKANKAEIKAISKGKKSELENAIAWLELQNGDKDGEAATSGGEIAPVTALLLEPDLMQAQQIADQLSALGITTVGVARHQENAISLAKRLRPDYLFAETVLVDGSGIDVANEISVGQSIKVVFITSYPEKLLTGPRPEPTFLVTKPFSHKTLSEVIDTTKIANQ